MRGVDSSLIENKNNPPHMSCEPTDSELFPDVNRSVQNSELDPDRPIFRYMRLPAFLMLLSDEVFIPTLATLRKSDPLESRLPYLCYPRFSTHFSPLTDSDAIEWLKKKMPKWKLDNIKLNEVEYPEFGGRFYVETWLDELANRRCIWCWYATANNRWRNGKFMDPTALRFVHL